MTSTWQPIDTCPEGTPVLVNNIWVGPNHPEGTGPLVAYRSNLNFYLVGSCQCDDVGIIPTHWMPLPEEPK